MARLWLAGDGGATIRTLIGQRRLFAHAGDRRDVGCWLLSLVLLLMLLELHVMLGGLVVLGGGGLGCSGHLIWDYR